MKLAHEAGRQEAITALQPENSDNAKLTKEEQIPMQDKLKTRQDEIKKKNTVI